MQTELNKLIKDKYGIDQGWLASSITVF
jgi:hypothetical protein